LFGYAYIVTGFFRVNFMGNVTIETLQRAAALVGCELHLELV
jgi:hypothetical protein